MKILMVGLSADAASKERIASYGAQVDELHCICFSEKKKNEQPSRIGNTFFYPTDSRSKPSFLLDAAKLGTQICRTHAIDVITCQDPFETGLVGARLARKFGLPLQLQIHGSIFSEEFLQDEFLNRPRSLVAKSLLARANAIRVVHSHEKEVLEKRGIAPAKIQVLPIRTDVEKFQNLPSKKSAGAVTFVTFARLEPVKNIELMLHSFADALKQNAKMKLVIGGDGSQKEELEKLAAHLDIADHVEFAGWQPAPDLLSRADVFVLSSNHEGFGRTIVEALAAGVPVISTDVGCARDFVKNGENGFVVKVRDRAALTAKMADMTDTKLRGKLETGARESLQDYISQEEYLREMVAGWQLAIDNFGK